VTLTPSRAHWILRVRPAGDAGSRVPIQGDGTVIGQSGRRGWLAAAAAVIVATACAADADEEPAVDEAADAPAQPAPAPAPPAAGANVNLPEGVTQDMVAQGEQIFNQQICFSCHGVNGVGGPLGPALTDQEWLNADGSYESIMNVIRTGVLQPKQVPGPMPAMGGLQLTDEQVRQVGAYVYALSHGG
jgi:mono/diheme cytochrome c family protein